MELRIGSRVTLHSRRHDGFTQPWRGRFQKGREGTVICGPAPNIHGWLVEWDHRATKYPYEWRMVHPADDLVVIQQL